MRAVKRSLSHQPFSDGEMRVIETYGKSANSLIKELWGFTDEQMLRYDWRLTYYQGRVIILKNLNFDGKGVKVAQFTLGEDGYKTFREWLKSVANVGSQRQDDTLVKNTNISNRKQED